MPQLTAIDSGSIMYVDFAYIGLTIVTFLFAFIANRTIKMSRQVDDLHTWQSKTDDSGAFVWYGKAELDEIKALLTKEK